MSDASVFSSADTTDGAGAVDAAGSADHFAPAPDRTPASAAGVWSELVGQQPTVELLTEAARSASHWLAGAPGARSGTGMAHAWLFTGPPGSGRSNAARAFAAALQCADGGCGTCTQCRTSLAGTHPDVTFVRTEQLSLRVDQIRDLVVRAAMAPVGDRWQILIIEDADRLTEQAADALLKSLEEPADRTIWMLCAPTVEDVVPTIRSRCRLLVLRTPSTEAVATVLRQRFGVEEELAVFAARASQGHIGRARALATDEDVRARRRDVLAVPTTIDRIGTVMQTAGELVEAAGQEAKAVTEELDAKERAELDRSLGVEASKGPKPRHAQAAVRDLEEQQKVRAKRLQRDALDRTLIDLVSYYRDVLTVSLGARSELINEELRGEIERRAAAAQPEHAVRAIDLILNCREVLEGNVAPQLAVEALLLGLREVHSGGRPEALPTLT